MGENMKAKRLFTFIFSSIFMLMSFQMFAANPKPAKQTQTKPEAQTMNANDKTQTEQVTQTEQMNGNMQSAQSKPLSKEDDNKITNTVKVKFRSEPLLSGSKIVIITKNGIVVLSGNLKTEQEASKAVELANSVEGVRDVDTSNLKPEASTQPFADTVISAKVKGAFIREKLFGKGPIAVTTITVETTNGTVYLIGTADSHEVVQNAEKLAKAISGVKRVENKIQVEANKNNGNTENKADIKH